MVTPTAAHTLLSCVKGACKYEAHDEPSEVEDVNKKWEEMKATWAGLSEHEKARCASASLPTSNAAIAPVMLPL